MKRVFFYAIVLSFFSANSFASVKEGLFFRPFLSIEYSAPKIENAGATSQYTETNTIGKQITNAENFAFGGNFRIHKFVGLNLNWSKTALKSRALQDISLSRKANFKLQQVNFSALGYLPVVDDLFEIFAEVGVADFNSKINYIDGAGNTVNRKAHETMAIYGAGFQITPFENSDDAIRFSYQRYVGKLALLDGNYSTVRIGYLKSF